MFNKEEYDKQWRINNPEKVKAIKKKYYQNNLKKMKEYRKKRQAEIKEYNKQYYQNHHEAIIVYGNNKQKTNIKYNLNHRMRTAIRIALKGDKDGRRWENLVGYNLNDLIKHLKSTMPEGYSWQDYMEGKLHIDHKIPICVFNYTQSKHTDFKRCWSLKNLQLLSVKENLSKGNELTRPFQPALLI